MTGCSPNGGPKFINSLLVGSVACLAAATGTQAADLATRKAAPVDYVRICAVHGPGFFYIPGSDTCIRIGGRARFEYVYKQGYNKQDDLSSFRALGRIAVDARTQTDFGLLRAFVRVDFTRDSGSYFGSGSGQRDGSKITFQGSAGTFPSFSAADTAGNKLQTGIFINRAFVQWGGVTAGRVQSFFDFYPDNDNWFGIRGSDALTQALAYTYTFASGFSATLSIEDPKERQINPVAGFAAVASGGINPAVATPNFVINYPFIFSPFAAPMLSPAGAGSAINYAQRETIPDVVGVLRVDQGWGSAQLSGAFHRVSTSGSTVTNLSPTNAGGLVANPLVPSVPGGYGAVHGNGWAVQGGVKINLPSIATGDTLYLQAAYSKGDTNRSYVNWSFPSAYHGLADTIGGTTFSTYDGVVGPSGHLTLTPAYSALFSFEHYWTPTIRQGLFVGGEHISYSGTIRTAAGYAAGAACPTCLGTVTTGNGAFYNPYSTAYTGGTLYNIGSTLVWSPVKDLDIGVQAFYYRNEMAHRQFDVNSGAGKLTKGDDSWDYRLRISRDF
ncbi:Porin subfamily protein [Rhizobiales bacterium GAS113]|nr:Porin subfamily protein [Rhizobiales bacterium GAS113]